ncbi:macro domain-containing protein [Lacrimispora amygdalina]|uniref:type II toxin-antitoxin system antitoxin DNA ADP-ribosyl glycohydrolase DarG n=1 Tax=Lacrimispora amygdalina TaxID=253257 RepID=UPI000BE28BC2|nr:macro domain-containing protein [Lacrimispora amygdalina]
MIKLVTGDMFASGADCLLNTVNCEGFMGKGVAYQFKMRFPENNKSYIQACKSGQLKVGKVHYFIEDGITIINFPTKDKWRASSKINYIEDGLKDFVQLLPKLRVKTIAVPPLGCGNGGLDWIVVKRIILESLDNLKDSYDFLIYEPSYNFKQKPKVAPELHLSSLVIMDLKMNLKKVSELRLQKSAYFLNYFLGENYFKFDKYKYGPYDYAISIIAKDIGAYQKYYNLSSTDETYNMVYKIICSEKLDKKLDKMNSAIKKSADYVNNISSNKDLEGIATVLYLIQNGKESDEYKLIKHFKEWSDDKANRFTEKDIKNYINYLENTNIIERNLLGEFNTI